jgi:hypothetical protein
VLWEDVIAVPEWTTEGDVPAPGSSFATRPSALRAGRYRSPPRRALRPAVGGDVTAAPTGRRRGDVQTQQAPNVLVGVEFAYRSSPIVDKQVTMGCDYHLSKRPTSGFKASMRLPTLKRLRSGQSRRPAQTPEPFPDGECRKTVWDHHPRGPIARRNT